MEKGLVLAKAARPSLPARAIVHRLPFQSHTSFAQLDDGVSVDAGLEKTAGDDDVSSEAI